MQYTKSNLKGKIKTISCSFTGGNLTKYAGLNKITSFMMDHKVTKNMNNLFPTKKYNATKFSYVQVLMSIIYASLSGVSRINKISNFTQDPLVQINLMLEAGINENTLSQRLKSLGQRGARALQKYFLKFNSNKIQTLGLEHITLDADSTVSTVSGHQEGAKKGYNPTKKGAKSYHPLLVFVSEIKLLYHSWFRSGDAHTANGITEFLKEVEASLPSEIKEVFFRADSGYFGGKLLDLLESFNWTYLIKVKLKNLKKLLNQQEWVKIKGKDIWICEFEYTTKSWNGKTRTLKAIRSIKNKEEVNFFSKKEVLVIYQYACFVSNLEGKNGLDLHLNYKQRSTSETWIEEVKSQILAGRTLTQDFWANDILWQLSCFSYNVSVLMRMKSPKTRRQEHKTFRDWFILIPGRIVSSGRKLELKIYENYFYKEAWIDFEQNLNLNNLGSSNLE